MRMTLEIRSVIADALRKARSKANLTQQQVADAVGLSRQMICRYENRKDAPTGENLGKLLRYFGISIQLPGYNWRLTSEALEGPPRTPRAPSEEQPSLFELNKPQEVQNANVRILRKEDSIEIVIADYSLIR